MKRLLLSLVAVLCSFASLKALPYDVARDNAYFLTDKMAYELNLTQDQYNQVYQINLDYFLSVVTAADLYGVSWSYRNEDIRYVLFDWQYNLYAAVDYFFRPLRWQVNRWYYPVFDRYRYGHYYFSRPSIYHSYHGGYGRRGHNGYSPYRHYRPSHGPGMRPPHHGGPGYGHGGPGYNHHRPGDGHHGGPGYTGGRPNNGHHGGGSGSNHSGGNHKPGNSGNYGNQGGGRPSGSGNVGGGNNHGRPSGSGNVGGGNNHGRPSGSGNVSGGNSGSRPSGGRSSVGGSRPSGKSNSSNGSGRSGRTFGR